MLFYEYIASLSLQDFTVVVIISTTFSGLMIGAAGRAVVYNVTR